MSKNRDDEIQDRLGGAFCHLHVTFEAAPEYDTWFKFWYRNDEVLNAMLTALEAEYRKQGLVPILTQMSAEAANKILRNIYFMAYPTWGHMVKEGEITPLICEN